MQFFIADTHFDDPNTFMYSRSGMFRDITEMNKTIVDNWNKTVSKNDEIFLLGDIGNYDYLNYLHGKIIIILGNHDNEKELKDCCPDIKYYDRPIFEKWMILSHEPIVYLGPQTPYLNIHGHTHNFSYTSREANGNLDWYSGNRYFNVSCEAVGFKPVSFEEIREAIRYVAV